jgi:hypothetical protein
MRSLSEEQAMEALNKTGISITRLYQVVVDDPEPRVVILLRAVAGT